MSVHLLHFIKGINFAITEDGQVLHKGGIATILSLE